MTNAPDNLRYSATHQWARREADGTVTVGITDHAQEALGDVVFLQAPEVGSRVQQGEPCAVIESVKAASDVHAPVSGEVLAVNAEIAERPETVNQDPYGAWLLRVRPDAAAEFDALLDAVAYRALVESEAEGS